MFKKYLPSILWLMILILSQHSGFTQPCYWSKQVSGNKNDGAGKIVITTDGNLFIAGGTQSTALYFQTDTLYSVAFLAKYDPDGNELWVKGFNAPFIRLVMDTVRNCLITAGTISQPCYFGDTLLTPDGLTIFIMKMDFNGNIIWIRTVGGAYCKDITCDPLGNIYIAGCNNDSAHFGDLIIPAGGFIAKYNGDGTVLWAKKKFRKSQISYLTTEALTESILVTDEEIFTNGEIYNDTIIIDTISIILENGYLGSFLASFSSDGNIKWIKIFGLPESQCGISMVRDKQGALYTTGRFFNTSIFGTDTLTTVLGSDCFIIKHRPNGEFEWVKQLNVTGSAWGLNLASDTSNTIYLSGLYSGTATFGNITLTSDSLDEVFVARYDPSGNCIGAFSLPNVITSKITTDFQGNLEMTGAFVNTATIGSNTFTSMGDDDIYIAKCSPITGIRNKVNPNDYKLLIYANPTTGKCNITVPQEFLHEKSLTLTLYDIQGKIVQSFTVILSENKIRLNLSAQASGIYNAVLTNGKRSYSGRIVFTAN